MAWLMRVCVLLLDSARRMPSRQPRQRRDTARIAASPPTLHSILHTQTFRGQDLSPQSYTATDSDTRPGHHTSSREARGAPDLHPCRARR
eukprot:2611047-Rhodomonas_salina.1